MEKLSTFFSNQKALAITGSILTFLIAAKIYFRGGICRVNRDLSDKVIVVTGGNAGIGKQTISALSHKPCTIIFGARDKKKSQQVLNSLRGQRCNLLYFPLDLSNKQSIQQFSQNVKKVSQKVDIVINNAGIFPPKERKETKDGFQIGMGVNHLGHFYLTYLLWPNIKRADKPRIINVSSQAHRGFALNKYFDNDPSINFQDFNMQKSYSASSSYFRSKMANVLFTKMLQKKLNESNLAINAYSLHPGVILTDLTLNATGLATKIVLITLKPLLFFFMKSPAQGAQTTLYLALENQQKLQKGAYYKDCKVKPTSVAATVQSAEKLWEMSEKSWGIKFDV